MTKWLERWSRGWSVKALFIWAQTEKIYGRGFCQTNRRRHAAKKRRGRA